MHHKSGSMSQHGSMDGASSESPHPPRADSGHTLENGAASNASSASHAAFRPRHAWNGVAAGDAAQQPARSHSGSAPSGAQPQPQQQQHSSTGSEMGAARGAAAGRGRGAAAVPPLSKEGNAAIAAATAAAAAALRPTPRTAGAVVPRTAPQMASTAAPAASGGGRGAGGQGQAKQSGNNHVAGSGDASKNVPPKTLNGNAVAFVPSLPPPNGLAPSSSLPNGTISYRNAAGAPNSSHLHAITSDESRSERVEVL